MISISFLIERKYVSAKFQAIVNVSNSRFVPDKEFSGTDRSATRSGPVQFEKDEEDPFGLDQFLKQAKRASSSTTTTTKRKDERDQRRDDRDKRRKH